MSRKGLKNQRWGPVVNLEHWFYINAWLANDSWPHKCKWKGKGFHLLAHAHAHTHRKPCYAYTRHRRFPLMDSPLPWRKYNSKSMRWRAVGVIVKTSRGTHLLREPTRNIGSGLAVSHVRDMFNTVPGSWGCSLEFCWNGNVCVNDSQRLSVLQGDDMLAKLRKCKRSWCEWIEISMQVLTETEGK